MTWVFFALIAIIAIGAQAWLDGHPWIGGTILIMGISIMLLDYSERRKGTLTSKREEGDGDA